MKTPSSAFGLSQYKTVPRFTAYNAKISRRDNAQQKILGDFGNYKDVGFPQGFIEFIVSPTQY
ncbi:hypothetical protein ACI01nite_22060 [Acetobacter cibinongensis]|uniref:Uncharacterized protein n=1 Tax=Acetobacter cibinongensis TaxID=146475 RepID=A0A0D6N124_9PROT|nr:hypothetical protein Abci_002_103 [Acetobacter cibinongensis]GEL59604.1 hypothetical protein ACI01nite_22060 [Acetobacter cibinongensis]